MPEVIQFLDVEQVVCAYLAPLLDVPVGTRVPKVRPAAFVRVVRTGGPRTSVVTEAAQVTVESWAGVDQQAIASDLAYSARAHLGAMQGEHGGTVVYVVREFSGPAFSPDPVSSAARYVQTFEVVVRGYAA